MTTLTRDPLFRPFESHHVPHSLEGEGQKPSLAVQPGATVVKAPLKPFNPTGARYDIAVHKTTGSAQHGKEQSGHKAAGRKLDGVHYRWRSRDNRKGRHTIALSPAAIADTSIDTPDLTNTWRSTLLGIQRMFTYYPIWDVSYLIAQCFTWGSVLFVLNGFFYWLPVVAPSTKFPHEGDYAAGITAFLGTILFQIGVVLMVFEAVNVNRSGCFGWALEEAVGMRPHSAEDGGAAGSDTEVASGSNFDNNTGVTKSASTTIAFRPDRDGCVHHHTNRHSLFGFHQTPDLKQAISSSSEKGSSDQQHTAPQKTSAKGKAWIWFPSRHDLTTYYIHELGFILAVIFFLSGTIFWIIGFSSLPGVYDHLDTASLWGAFWIPDIVGSIGFIAGSWLIMLETQKNWWRPALHVLGWHIGLWNVIGSVGFALSAIFGIADQVYTDQGREAPTWLLYQSDLSTTWGSIAFLIASVVQWFESVNKHSVEKL